jgi:Dyp-type peroxidase family
MAKVEKVEWHDVQGLVLSGYPRLPFSAYIPWQFGSGDRLSWKSWLRGIADRVVSVEAVGRSKINGRFGGGVRPGCLAAIKVLSQSESALADVWVLNIALTASGLARLGVGQEELCLFSAEFREGMAPQATTKGAPSRRSNILGDIGVNSPLHWRWGGWSANGRIDGMLLLYAGSGASLQRLVQWEVEQMKGIDLLSSDSGHRSLVLEGRIYEDRREHFGFKDGISQPIIVGTKEGDERRKISHREERISLVRPGEFVLGYLNERHSRVSYALSGPHGPKGGAGAMRDLGRNGTYLVFRELEQNVCAFRRAMSRIALELKGDDSEENRNWVAARFVGRMPDGEPLISASGHRSATKDRNDFLYYFEDPYGLACPLGAHIRRANPRDLLGPTPDAALRLSKMHRIIRRGRPYGKRASKSDQTQNERHGLLFICLNADIAGQFELIQHSWINNGRFNGLQGESDPVMHYPGEDRLLTIQRKPTSDGIVGLDQFVVVRGGAYFFLPGLTALRSLAG